MEHNLFINLSSNFNKQIMQNASIEHLKNVILNESDKGMSIITFKTNFCRFPGGSIIYYTYCLSNDRLGYRLHNLPVHLQLLVARQRYR